MERREVNKMWWCTPPHQKKFPCGRSYHPKIPLQNSVSALPAYMNFSEDIYSSVETLCFCVAALFSPLSPHNLMEFLGVSQDTH